GCSGWGVSYLLSIFDSKSAGREVFGGLRISILATSIRPPAPSVGVAELFRNSITAAVRYRQARRWSRHRLRWALIGVLSLLTILTIFSGVMAVKSGSFRPLPVGIK